MTTSNSKTESYSFLLDSNIPPPFSVGLALNLQTGQQKSQKNRFPVQLAGWIRPHYLLAAHNHYDTGVMAIPKDSELIVRYIYEGQIYGFATRLIHKHSEPQPLWLLEYPLEIEVINLRQSSRVPITIEVKTSDGEIYFTRDISTHGAQLRLSSQSQSLERKLNDKIELSFSLPDGTAINKLTASLIRVYLEQNQKTLAVKFFETDGYNKRQMELLGNYLKKVEKDFAVNPQLFAMWE